MAMENDKIKDLFSSKLGNFEPEVPASVWGGLDQLLSNQPVQTPDASSSSSSASSSAAAGKASLIKTIAVIVGLTAAITATVLVLTPDKQSQIAEEKKEVTEKFETPVIEEKEEEIVELVPPVASIPSVQRETVGKEEPIHEVEDAIVENKSEIIEEKGQPEPVVKEQPVVIEESLITENVSVVELPKFFTKDISLGITTNIGLFSDKITERGGGLLFSRNVRGKVFMDALAEENGEFILEHKRPVSFGFIVSKHITSRLSVETGLEYTYLSSKITSNSMYNIRENQSFNYLGIPLSLNYTFYQLGKTKLYLSVGGMVQKDIRGKYESTMDFSKLGAEDQITANEIFYQEPYYIKKTIKQSNPQFSVRTKLGVAYPLYKKLYLYGTIGGAYYFDAGNEYRTIYSDKKTQLDLNLGVKFDF